MLMLLYMLMFLNSSVSLNLNKMVTFGLNEIKDKKMKFEISRTGG